MSWKKYEPPISGGATEKMTIPVVVSLTGQGPKRTGRLRLKVLVRPEFLDGGLSWWKKDTLVSLLIGTEENAGSIKIQPGGTIKLCMAGGINGRAILSVPAWPGLSTTGVKSMAVEFDHSEKWIEIELPGATLAKVPGTPAPASAPLPTAARSPLIEDKPVKPFVGLGSSGPHPHPDMQRPATRTPRP